MTSPKRRQVLQLSCSGLLLMVAGCSGPFGRDGNPGTAENKRTVTFDTPNEGECDATPVPKPTPTEEGLEPAEYPPYPDSITKQTSVQFATEFEQAYQHNDFLKNEFIQGTDEIGVSAGAERVIRSSNGFTIGVRGVLQTGNAERPEYTTTPTPTPAPNSTSAHSSWYYLTDRFALRNELSGDRTMIDEDSEPQLDTATVISCA